MIQRDYLILGSGIGGASACEGVRKHDKRGSVTIVGAEIMPPYNRWMLSKDFLRERTVPLKKLANFDQRWFDSHKIETRFATIVKQFNIERRLAVLGNGESIARDLIEHADCKRAGLLATTEHRPGDGRGRAGATGGRGREPWERDLPPHRA